MPSFTKSKAYPWALVGIFAAFHLVLSMIPYSVLGMGGGFLTWGMVSAPIVGFLLGPFYGPISVFIGSFLGVNVFNPGGILGPLVPTLAPTAGAFAAGALRTGKPRLLFVLFLVAVLAFIASPIGIPAFMFIWLHLVTLVIIILLLIPRVTDILKDATSFEEGRNIALMSFGIWLFSFIALLTDHVVGNAVSVYHFVYVLGWDPVGLVDIWLAITFVYPVERLVASIILAVVVIAVGEAIRQTNLELPITPWESVEARELTPEEIEKE
ncbi:MAG: hypothetical protein ACE5H4_05705 [Candidatus Thorarchaeota archaeon]